MPNHRLCLNQSATSPTRGERVGVLLDLAAYQRIENSLALDPDCLPGLSVDELQALANCKLSTAEQTRLDHLLARNTDSQLEPQEILELDHLLNETDHLTTLKARARYTLQNKSPSDDSSPRALDQVRRTPT